MFLLEAAAGAAEDGSALSGVPATTAVCLAVVAAAEGFKELIAYLREKRRRRRLEREDTPTEQPLLADATAMRGLQEDVRRLQEQLEPVARWVAEQERREELQRVLDERDRRDR